MACVLVLETVLLTEMNTDTLQTIFKSEVSILSGNEDIANVNENSGRE